MKLLASFGLLVAILTHAHGQARPIGTGGVIRFRVRSADPYMIKAMLTGMSITQPELSTILGFAGIPDQDSQLIESLFGGQGRLVVDPTDNSILFFPKKG